MWYVRPAKPQISLPICPFYLPADDSHEISSLNYNKNEEIHRGSYMSAHVLLNLLNKLGKSHKMRGLSSILSLFPNDLINSIIQEHKN